jgi:hypothetical protein
MPAGLPASDWVWVAIIVYVTVQFGLGMAIFVGHVIPMLLGQ